MAIASDFYPTLTTVTAGETVYEYTDTMNNLYFEPNMKFDNSICFAKSDKPIVSVNHAVGSSIKGWNWESFKFNTGDIAFFKPSVDISDGDSNLLVALAECGRGVQGYEHSLQFGVTHNSDSAKYINANYMRFLKNGELKNMYSWIQFNGYKISENMKSVTITIQDLYENANDYLIENIRNYTTYCKDGVGTSVTNKFYPVFIMDNNLYTGVFTLRNIFNSHSTPTINCRTKTMSGGSSAFLYQSLDINYVREFNNPPITGDGINIGWNRDNPPSGEYITVGENYKTLIQAKWSATFASDGTVNGLTLNTFRRLVKGEYALEILAYTGVFYTDDTTHTPWNGFDSHIYCGYMDNKGITTGEMLRGTDIDESDTAQKEYHINNNIFNPDYKPVHDDNDDIDNMTFGHGQYLNGFIKYYHVTIGELAQFAESISSLDVPTGVDLKTNIVSLKSYSVNASKYIDSEIQSEIEIGGYKTGVTSALKIIHTTDFVKLGEYFVDGNNDFTDYNPYSTYEIYIPCCGWIPISDKCVNKTITTYHVFDLINGTVKGIVTCTIDGKETIIGEKAGIIGVDTAISSTANGLFKASAISSILDSVGTSVKVSGAILSKDVGKITTGIADAIGSVTQSVIASNQNYTSVTGANADNSIFGLPKTCFIKISRMIKNVPDNYGRTIGYICNKTKKLSNVTGFTICDNVDTDNLSCIESEKEKIKSILETGVYL